MAVVIEELEVQAEPAPAAEPARAEAKARPALLDERALCAWLAREQWRAERLAAD